MAKESYLVQWYDDDGKEAGSIVLKVASLPSAHKWAEKLLFRYPKVEITDYYRHMESEEDFEKRTRQRATMTGSPKRSECIKVEAFKEKYTHDIHK